ncbi:MAG TPA: AAA family ATPase [Gemmatimonadales bacterium]|nr:AAA family ATPase [Gemmatimonadales bacterium]HRZ08249.1 AAA family ATPase [Gemmatimonadales bacterium]
MGIPASLRCLGRPVLLDASGTPVRLKSQKQLALLIYLVIEGRAPLRRDRLADLLWSTSGINEARHSMGTAIWGLRHRVDPKGFPGDHQSIRTTVELECDLHRLAKGDVLPTEFVPALELDGFLEEFEIPDAPGFNHWRDQQRARLWPAIEAGLVRQMDHCRRTGDFTAIEPLADRTLRHNPLSEAAVRARIEGRAFAGDRIGALQAFETWKHSLHVELHAEPSEQLEAMARRLRRGTLEGGGDGNRPRVPTEQWRDRTFVGRTVEYRALYEAWERTTRGEPTHALVLGESGIGKSTLIQRLLTASSLDGAVTSRVQCYELEREIPYAALGALVRGLLERPEAKATAPQSLADLAQAVPAVREWFPHLPESHQLQGESFRIRVTDAMEALLRTIAEETPVLLVVDDFHLADDASVAVVHLLVRRFEQERIMVTLAARPTSANESPNIAKLRESHRRLGFVSLEVPPMTRDESAEMLDSLTADRVAPGRTVRDAMLRAAGGYPMALELFVSEWLGSGESSLALAVPAMREEVGQHIPPVDAYRMALDRICEGLDAGARLILQLAAVLGPRLNQFAMYQIVDLGLGATGQAMGTLRSARLLRETEERLEFVNELTRGHAYLGIPSPMRTALHGEVVKRLLAEEATGNHPPGLEVAWHLIRAGRGGEATPYLLSGARESMRGGAPHEAERGLSTAMDRLEEPDKSEALLLLGESLQEQGRMQESIEFLDAVSDSSHRSVISRRNVLRLYARRYADGVSPDANRALGLQLIAEAENAEESNTRLRALWVAAHTYRDHLDLGILHRVWDQLRGEKSGELSLEDQAEYALGIATCQYLVGDKHGSLKTVEGVIGKLERQGILNSIYLSLIVGLGAIRTGLGEYDAAVAVGEKGVHIARKVGDERRIRMLAGNLALSHCRLGNVDSQLEWADRAAAIPASYTGIFEQQQIHFSRARAFAVQGRESDALAALAVGRSIGARPIPDHLQQAWHLRTADVLSLLGRHSKAIRAAVPGVTGEMSNLGSDAFAGPFARWSAKVAVAKLADLDATRTKIAELLEREQRLDHIDNVEVLNSKVWLDSRTGRMDDEERTKMWTLVSTLPAGATQELRSLGMLDL